MHDLHANNEFRELAPPAARTTTFNGSAIDVRDLQGVGAAILASALGTGTTPTLDGKIEDSVDGSAGWADVTGATFAQVTDSANTVEAIALDFNKTRGFIRFTGTIAGGTPSFTFSAAVVGRFRQSV